MNYMDPQQQQYLIQQGQRLPNARTVQMPANIPPQHMQRQPRYAMPILQAGQQQPMQMSQGQYVQALQPRTINDMLSRLPPDVQQIAQQQISSESNIERKKQIAMSFIQSNRMRNFQNQMGTQGVMVNMTSSQQGSVNQGLFLAPKISGSITGNMPPLMRLSSTQSGGMPQMPVYGNQVSQMVANTAQMAPSQMSIQRMPNHNYAQSTSTSSQLSANFAPHEQTTHGLPSYSSPQASTISQPPSVGLSLQPGATPQQKGPNSVPSTYLHHPPVDTSSHSTQGTVANEGADKANSSDEALYNQKLEILKTYMDQVKKQMERDRLDGLPPRSSYERLVEIMENRRRVDLKLMEKLIGSVKNMIIRSNICFPLLEAIRSDTDNLKTVLPDPWADFRQYAIRVPDEVLALSKENVDNGRKRARTPSAGMALPLKHFKKENHDGEMLYVECANGSRIYLSNEASSQLRRYKFRFDPDCIPISSGCTEVIVIIENDLLLLPPLRLVVPINYPENGAHIARDYQARGLMQIDDKLGLSPNGRSIDEIVNAWKCASQHMKRVSNNKME